MSKGTLTQLFFEMVSNYADKLPCAYRAKVGGSWHQITHRDAEQRARQMAIGLRELGIKPGDRVALLSETRVEWALADFACLCSRAVDVPIYPTLTAKQVEYILKDSGAVAVFCSTGEQVMKVQEIQQHLPGLKHVIAFESGAARSGVMLLGDLEAKGKAAEGRYPRFKEEALAVSPDDLATLIYTSGTTGDPKGVMLTHNNIWSNVQAALQVLDLGDAEECLAMLPLSHIFERTGGRVRFFVSGSAPLSAEIAKFFFSASLPIIEGYGLTETSPVLTLNPIDRPKLGSVGPVVPGVQLKIAADGEILAKGPNIMKGYYNKPEATKEVFDADGWFLTGDIGELDADGYLKITDRKKDLLKTAGGKYIAPQPIENQVKLNKFVANAVVLGDKRKFPIILIVPSYEQLEKWAATRGLSAASHAALLALADVKAKIEREVMGQLRELAKYEMPKKVLLIENDFTIESGELTPTLKVKRRVVETYYKEAIDKAYAEADKMAAAIEG